MKPEIEEILSGVALFEGLPALVIKEIAVLAQPRSMEEGGFYFMQGDEARYLYVLSKGRVKLSQASTDGQQVGMRIIVPGQMFAATAILNPKSGYPVTAEALDDSSALAWEGSEFRKITDKYPQLLVGIMEIMRAYVVEMQARYRELSTERVEQRVANALVRLTGQAGEKQADGGIELSLSRQDLAEMSGTTLFTVSRLLSEWERRGLIETGRERVRILNPHRLVAIAEDLAKK